MAEAWNYAMYEDTKFVLPIKPWKRPAKDACTDTNYLDHKEHLIEGYE